MIRIKLNGKKGVDYNAYVAGYFDNFSLEGFPVFLPDPQKFNGKELLFLGKDQGKNTQSLIMEGKNFLYDFAGHTVSGSLQKVTLATLGKSYKKGGAFKTDKKGFITKTSDTVEISGLKVSNGKGERGDFHKIVSGLMGSVSDSGTSGKADPTLLLKAISSQGQKVTGTKKNDKYLGTDHADKVNLGKGNDVIDGGLGNDVLKGGKGKDTFVFSTTLGPKNVDRIKDFTPKDDKIHLSKAIFDEIGLGKLSADAFVKGSAATSADTRIVYDNKSGALYYDADGNGAGAQVQFATVGKNLGITADHFFVV